MRHILGLMTLLWATALTAQPVEKEARPFSLQQAQDYAAQHAYSVQQAQLEVQKARQTIRQTAARGLPQIGGSFGYSYNAQIREQPVPAQFVDPTAPEDEFVTLAFGVAHQNTANLQLNQLLVDASYFVALQATRVLKETRRLEKESTEIDARKNAAQSYYGVLIAQETEKVLEDNLENLRKNLRETRQLYEKGFVEEQDADQLELLVNNLQNSLQNARRQTRLARQLLKFNLGLPLTTPLRLTDDLATVVNPGNNKALLLADTFRYQDHIDYRALRSQERGAILQVKNQKAKWYPTLNGVINHGQSRFSNDFEETFNFDARWIPNTTFGVSLNWNILQGLSRPALVQEAKLDLERVAVAKEQTTSQLKLQYQQALSDYRQALDNYRNQQQNVNLSRSIRDKTLRKYQEGISSSLELTQAQNQFLETQRSYLNATRALLNAKEELENALGK